MVRKRKLEDISEGDHVPKDTAYCSGTDTTIRLQSRKLVLRSSDLRCHLKYFDSWTGKLPSTFGVVQGKLIPIPYRAKLEKSPTALEKTLILFFDFLFRPEAIQTTELTEFEAIARLADEYGASTHFKQSMSHHIQSSLKIPFPFTSYADTYLKIANSLRLEDLFRESLQMVVARWRHFKCNMKDSPLYTLCDTQHDIFMDQRGQCLANMLNAYKGTSLSGSAVAGQFGKRVAKLLLGKHAGLESLTLGSSVILIAPIADALRAVENGMDAGSDAQDELIRQSGDNEDVEEYKRWESDIDRSMCLVAEEAYLPEVKQMAEGIREALLNITDKRYPGMFIPNLDGASLNFPWNDTVRVENQGSKNLSPLVG